MSNTHGGKRPGAGSGGKRPGAGRKQRKHKFHSHYVMERQPLAGLPQRPQMWRVLSVSDTEIEFQDWETEDIIVLRLPDDFWEQE